MLLSLPYSLKTHAAALIVGLAFGAAIGLLGPRCSGQDSTLPSIDADVAKHAVTETAPVKALDKQELRRRAAISKSVAKEKTAEVLATGKVSDASGSRTVAAVLDTKTGDTRLVQKRPFAEWMSRNRIGIGYGYGVDGEERGIRYERTIGRVWGLYGSAQAEVVRRESSDSAWRVMLWLDYQF